MPEAKPTVIIRMGTHAEKEYLEKTLRFFDGLILGANLVEATPGATASLLLKFGGRKANQSFYIDPMTYAFGAYRDKAGKVCSDLDWIKSDQKRNGKTIREFKRSYRALAVALGKPFQAALSRKSALTWTDFANAARIKECCQSVIDYQWGRIESEFASDSELKPLVDNSPRPTAVFAPYFYCEPSNAMRWLDLGLELARVTAALPAKAPVHAVICADESFLGDKPFLDKLKKSVPDTGVAGVWLWFSRFMEDLADMERLKAFRSLVETLSDKVQVFNMHGGYFSLTLCKHGMSGISHGIGYGEQKDILPVIGQSTPTVRYYLPDASKRFGIPPIVRCFDALKIKTPADFHKQVCNCVICKGVVSSYVDEFSAFGEMYYSTPQSQRKAQTPSAAKRCRFHFLLTRIRERDALITESVADIIGRLDKAKKKWGPQPSMNGELNHLDAWREVLR
jgi:hypothetical protein